MSTQCAMTCLCRSTGRGLLGTALTCIIHTHTYSVAEVRPQQVSVVDVRMTHVNKLDSPMELSPEALS